MATSTITALTNTNTIDGATVFPADYSGATYKVSVTTLGAFITTNATTLSASGNVTGNYILGNGSQLTGIDATSIQSGTSNVRVASSGGNVTVGIGGTSNVAVFNTGGVVIKGDIDNGASNAVGNIGSSSTYFNRLFAQATTALYADLAENYVSDADYVPGTVLDFGGEHEVTISTVDSSKRVAGVVSTNPAHLMNAGVTGEHVVTVALIGRVPVKVTGTVRKGDTMVSAGDGLARADADPRVGTVIGKALEDFDGDEGTIEIVIGKH